MDEGARRAPSTPRDGPVLVVDFGTSTSCAAVVAGGTVTLVREPAGAWNRPSAVWLGGEEILLGNKIFRTDELVAEVLRVLRRQGEQLHGAPITQAVLTIPASYGPADPRRDLMITAAELAGFTEVELLPEPVAAAHAPVAGEPFAPGAVALIYDFGGATFTTAAVRIAADGDHQVLGHAALDSWGGQDIDARLAAIVAPEIAHTITCCRELLERLGCPLDAVTGIVMIGASSRLPAVVDAVARELGTPLRQCEDPTLAVISGAAQWALHSPKRVQGPWTVSAGEHPLRWRIAGGTATVVRWLVEPGELFEAGAPLVVVRNVDGTLWRLAADDRPGSLAATFADVGETIVSGAWLATAVAPSAAHLTLATAAPSPGIVGRHDGSVLGLAFSPDGRWLATAGRDSTVAIWDIPTRELVHRFEHPNQVNAVAFSPDGRWLATAGDDHQARIWNVRTGRCLHLLSHANSVQSVAFDPTQQWLASGSTDATAKVWDSSSGRCLVTFSHSDAVHGVVFGPAATVLTTACQDGNAATWDLATGECLRRLAHSSTALTPVLDVYGDVFRKITAFQQGLFGGHHRVDRIYGVAISPDGRLLATASSAHNVTIWDLVTNGRRGEHRHGGKVLATAFSPDASLLVTAGADQTAMLWEVAEMPQLRMKYPHDDEVLGVVFSPDGRRFATACADGTARLHLVEP